MVGLLFFSPVETFIMYSENKHTEYEYTQG